MRTQLLSVKKFPSLIQVGEYVKELWPTEQVISCIVVDIEGKGELHWIVTLMPKTINLFKPNN